MNTNLIVIVIGISIICIFTILLLFFHSNKIGNCVNKNLKSFVFKKKINKNVIGYNQNWKCANCNGVILSNFRITSIQKQDFAICMSCAPTYTCVDDKCLV